MKKILGIVMGVIGFIIISIGTVFIKVKDNTSASIIGGSDGPTAIFLVDNQSSITMMIIGLIVLLIGVIILLKKRKWILIYYTSFNILETKV